MAMDKEKGGKAPSLRNLTVPKFGSLNSQQNLVRYEHFLLAIVESLHFLPVVITKARHVHQFVDSTYCLFYFQLKGLSVIISIPLTIC